MSKKYEVKIVSKVGSCNDEVFELMVKNGDITATKISEIMGMKIKITGYSECIITTEDKEFTILYLDTEEYGLISAGSEIFKKSVETYYGKVEEFIIKDIKTSKGKTYKAVPCLNKGKKEEKKTIKEDPDDELPF